MKTFRQYLSEGKQTFKYDVKIAHDLEPDQIKGIITRLSKTFDVIESEKIKPIVTPVESSPNGFPEVKNQSVTILKLEFKYPVTEPQIIQLTEFFETLLNEDLADVKSKIRISLPEN